MEFMVRSPILFISLFTQGFLGGTAFYPGLKPHHKLSNQPKSDNLPSTPATKPTTRNTPKAPATKPTTRTKLGKWLKKQLESETSRTIKDTIKDIGVSEIKKLINPDPSPAEAAGNAPGNEEPTRNVLFSPDDNSNDGFLAIQDSPNEYPNIYQESEKEEDQQVDQEEEDQQIAQEADQEEDQEEDEVVDQEEDEVADQEEDQEEDGVADQEDQEVDQEEEDQQITQEAEQEEDQEIDEETDQDLDQAGISNDDFLDSKADLKDENQDDSNEYLSNEYKDRSVSKLQGQPPGKVPPKRIHDLKTDFPMTHSQMQKSNQVTKSSNKNK
ncbi:hypothetical protein DSO57_1001653 [Entomophthora muscae]|uniref:Uncharacterized protein n=1 Tax=Entomophthora muscae TaxID=34485 RepID=A0ACC2S057_9FUNG|nr:hypothetical protein DSO57_1001653 [Entomophthora muscae]